MFNLRHLLNQTSDLSTSQLFDEISFYKAFIQDIVNCKKEVIIESPYITYSRMEKLKPVFKKLLTRSVKICLVTRDPAEHDENFRYQATNEILECIEMGIRVILLKGNHHRKIAIIDRVILWEGSLNILSFNRSQEVMRRIKGEHPAKEMLKFLNIRSV